MVMANPARLQVRQHSDRHRRTFITSDARPEPREYADRRRFPLHGRLLVFAHIVPPEPLLEPDSTSPPRLPARIRIAERVLRWHTGSHAFVGFGRTVRGYTG
jgi:hypothetical protein